MRSQAFSSSAGAAAHGAPGYEHGAERGEEGDSDFGRIDDRLDAHAVGTDDDGCDRPACGCAAAAVSPAAALFSRFVYALGFLLYLRRPLAGGSTHLRPGDAVVSDQDWGVAVRWFCSIVEPVGMEVSIQRERISHSVFVRTSNKDH
jgi:hypothetical protein